MLGVLTVAPTGHIIPLSFGVKGGARCPANRVRFNYASPGAHYRRSPAARLPSFSGYARKFWRGRLYQLHGPWIRFAKAYPRDLYVLMVAPNRQNRILAKNMLVGTIIYADLPNLLFGVFIMIHDPKAAANEFINRGILNRYPLTHIEVQKLVYFAHGWMLAIHHRPLHQGTWEAWQYGPVLPEIYYNLRDYRGRPITVPIQARPELFADEEGAIIDVVYGYRSLGPFQLVGITHSPGGPWDRVWNAKGGSSGLISNEMIHDYFVDLLRRNEVRDDG